MPRRFRTLLGELNTVIPFKADAFRRFMSSLSASHIYTAGKLCIETQEGREFYSRIAFVLKKRRM